MALDFDKLSYEEGLKLVESVKSAGLDDIPVMANEALDWLKDYAQKRPGTALVLGGTGLGGATGLVSSLFQPSKRKRILSRTLTGAGIGGASGLGLAAAKEWLVENPNYRRNELIRRAETLLNELGYELPPPKPAPGPGAASRPKSPSRPPGPAPGTQLKPPKPRSPLKDLYNFWAHGIHSPEYYDEQKKKLDELNALMKAMEQSQ